jgi:phosphate starvation-inducible PhoH-like protein
MARKKNLKGLDEADLELIESKMQPNKTSLTEGEKKSLDFKVEIKCKNQKQKDFLKILNDEKNEICFGIGSAGSGKSYISLAYAMKCIGDQTFKRIICMVPTCEAGAMSLGYLKGTLENKVEPYIEADTYTMKKILSNSGNYNEKNTIDRLIHYNIVSYEFVNFARGKTFDDALILVNEAENYSKEEMLLILTRMGENSKIIITGDLKQTDRKDIKRGMTDCGLSYAVDHLKDLDEVSVIEFTEDDIVRNPLITKILTNWD